MGPGPIYSQGFALLSSGDEPCPLSLSHGFSPYSHRQARDEKKEQATFFPSMSEQGELRSRLEERMENGVKNLKGSEAISQNLLVAF